MRLQRSLPLGPGMSWMVGQLQTLGRWTCRLRIENFKYIIDLFLKGGSQMGMRYSFPLKMYTPPAQWHISLKKTFKPLPKHGNPSPTTLLWGFTLTFPILPLLGSNAPHSQYSSVQGPCLLPSFIFPIRVFSLWCVYKARRVPRGNPGLCENMG